jgi:WD40 repeat protein
MIPCPGDDKLRLWLADALPKAEREALMAHSEACPACQERLARLSSEAAGVNLDLLRAEPHSDLSPVDAEVLRHLEQTPPSGAPATQAEGEPAPQPISFPGPPTDKGPLGQLDTLHIRRELGNGRYGVVYEAVDELDRLVAVKVLRPELAADPRERTRFEQEARKAAAVRHDHIVTVYRVGAAPGCVLPFLIMEYLEAETLGERLRRAGPLPPREAADVVRQVALGLAVAHARGLVHRDVKPSNILLEKGSGRAKITDFGLARDTAASAVASQSAAVVGTPAYMSPEQITTPDKVDLRSDIYCLGAALYEALTGERPFRGVAHVVLEQVVHDEPRPPRRLNDAVPRELETIALKCLAKEPGRRYQSAGDLAEDLQRWLEGRPIQARPVGVLGRTSRWCRRKPGLAGALGAAAFFLVAGTIASSLLAIRALGEARRADEQAASARANEQLAKKNAELAGEEKRGSDRRHYASEMKLASLDWEAGRTSMVQQRLRAQVPDPGAPDLRGFEWYYLNRLCQLELRTLQGHKGRVHYVAFSPDGKYLASSGADHSVRLWEMATSREIYTLRGHSHPVWGIAFSPDGKYLASGSEDHTIRFWDVATGRQSRALLGHGGGVNTIAFSPDGKDLVSASGDATAKVWDLATGKARLTFREHNHPVWAVAYSPDGKRLASSGVDRTVRVWAAATGKVNILFEQHTDAVGGLEFSPDGRRLASGSWDGTVRIWDLSTGKPGAALEGHQGQIYSLAFSPDGRRLASASQDQTVRVWDVATGQTALVLREHTHRVYGVAFSPDGRRIASAGLDETVRIWDAALRYPGLTLEGHADRVYGVAFSPDGSRLASASGDGTVRLWDATGRENRTLRGHKDQVRAVAFRPDGRRLASTSTDGTVRIWDAATGLELHQLHGHTGSVWGVAFSPDGRWLASGSDSGSDGTVRVWEAASGRPTLILPAHRGEFWGVVFQPAFSPDSKHLAVPCGDNTVKVYDAATGQQVLTCRGHTKRAIAVAFSPDGKYLASGGDDQTVILRDAATGEPIRTFQTQSGAVLSVAFSPDGRRLASAGGDPTVRVWDTATGQELLTLQGHARGVIAVAFSKDGRRLASASLDGTVKIWDGTDPTPQRSCDWEARGLVQWLFARPLTAEEVAAAVRRDASITEAVRQKALAWVEPLRCIRLRAEAAEVVRPLFRKPLLRSEVLEKLRTNAGLSPAVRQEGLALAETFPEDAWALHSAAWETVRRPDAGAAAYERALRLALASDRLVPPDWFISTRGVAYYRVGQYEEALKALMLSNKSRNASHVDDLAFLAMTQHQLRQTKEAQATLTRLYEVMQQPQWANNAEAQFFLRQAEEVLKTKPASAKK